uniref:Uncharacterized protein n=1 Tax=Oryzias latipes TaxID=8090 RepID=A0A3B3HFS2_ORYLA
RKTLNTSPQSVILEKKFNYEPNCYFQVIKKMKTYKELLLNASEWSEQYSQNSLCKLQKIKQII